MKASLDGFVGDLWSRFVTEFREDQDLLAKESQQRFNFRPIITNYAGNTQETIKHRLGESSTFAQWASLQMTITLKP